MIDHFNDLNNILELRTLDFQSGNASSILAGIPINLSPYRLLARSLPFQGGGGRSILPRDTNNAHVAQSGEHRIVNPEVAGSKPVVCARETR